MRTINVRIDHEDERGFISDIVENEEINAITLISINKGKVRGNHYHNYTIQYNYVISGKVRLITRLDNEEKKEIVLHQGDVVYTELQEEHALYAIEDSKLLIFTRGPRAGKEYESDTFRLKSKLI